MFRLHSLTSSFSLFVYFISPFLYVISSVLSILLPSLLVQIGVGFPAALAVNFLLAFYYWLLDIFSSCFLILSKFNGGSLDKLPLSLLDYKLINLAHPFLYQELYCKQYLFNFNVSLYFFSLSAFCLVSLLVVVKLVDRIVLLQKFSTFSANLIIYHIYLSRTVTLAISLHCKMFSPQTGFVFRHLTRFLEHLILILQNENLVYNWSRKL